MGNAIVIPSFQDWYLSTFKKLKIKNYKHLESGTFLLVFEGYIKSEKIVIKGYEYNQSLKNLPEVQRALSLFELASDISINIPSFIPYSYFTIEGTTGYLVRPYFDTSLEEAIAFHAPPLVNAEKTWIAFQLCATLLSMHRAGIYHGDLKPANIFITSSMLALITDFSPFKPRTVSPNRVNTYYHFFTAGTGSGMYLAPERFSVDDKEIDMKAADLFALGCILYYIFSNGEHLFDLTTGLQYAKGKYSITEKTSKIQKKSIRQIILNLVSVNINDRKEQAITLLTKFPEQLKIFYDMFKSFDVNDDFNPKIDIPKLVSLSETGFNKYRIIVIDFINNYFPKINDIDNIDAATSFYSEYVKVLDDSVKCVRLIPTLALKLETQSNPTAQKMLLTAILGIIKTIHEIPNEYTGIFISFLNPILIKIGLNNKYSAMHIASFLPPYTVELIRLHSYIESFSTEFGFVAASEDIQIYEAFVNEMEKYAKFGIPLLQAYYFCILSAFNQSEINFKIGSLNVLIAFFKNLKPKYPKVVYDQYSESLFQICHDLLLRKPTQKILSLILELLAIAFSTWNFDISFAYSFVPLVHDYIDSPNTEIRYFANKIMVSLPFEIQIYNLLDCDFKKTVGQIIPASKVPYQFIPMEVPESPRINPRFRASCRLSRSPIEFILPIPQKKLVIVAEGTRKISFRKLSPIEELPQKGTKMFRSEISDMSQINGNDKIGIGYQDGKIDLLDLAITRTSTIYSVDSPIRVLEPCLDNSIISGYGSTISFFDLRMKNPAIELKFSCTVSDITAFPRKDLLTAGFKEGLASVIDLRIGKSVYFQKCNSVKQIIPISDQSLSFIISSDDGTLSYHKRPTIPSSLIPLDGILRPYKNGCFIASLDSNWYIDAHGLLRLDDMSVTPCVSDSYVTYMPCGHRSHLTRMASGIKSLDIYEDNLIIGGSDGFVSFMTLC